MNYRTYTYSKLKMLCMLCALLILGSCERDPSGDTEYATFSKTGDIFTDSFIGMGTNFFFPFIEDGAKADVFSVDETTGYESEASIRIVVPDANDPDGGFAGAIFLVDGAGRNLTEFDALTFWAKSSQNATVGTFGFGEGKYQTLLNDLDFTSEWKKFIIPIPDPSKLLEEKGMFLFAAGGIGEVGQEKGYTFWLDEIKFEKLGTIAQGQPNIYNGEDISQLAFTGSPIQISGLTQTFNMPNGLNQTVNAAPSYFNFTSSDNNVAIVNELGEVTVIDLGTTEITASLANVAASGSLTVEVIDFIFAPTPTEVATNVISIFSDAYQNVPVDFYNGYYAPFQTTTSNDFEVNGDHILNYENFNFVGIEFNQNVSTIDATNMNFLHVDIFVPDSFQAGSSIKINLVDFGADMSFGGGDDTSVSLLVSDSSTPALVSGQWISIDMDITSLTIKNNLGQIVLDSSDNTSPRPSSFYVDNIYLYQ